MLTRSISTARAPHEGPATDWAAGGPSVNLRTSIADLITALDQALPDELMRLSGAYIVDAEKRLALMLNVSPRDDSRRWKTESIDIPLLLLRGSVARIHGHGGGDMMVDVQASPEALATLRTLWGRDAAEPPRQRERSGASRGSSRGRER